MNLESDEAAVRRQEAQQADGPDPVYRGVLRPDGSPRSAGTYDDELEALSAARNEQGKQAGGSLDSMTLAEKRAVTFEQFWPIFQKHHRVEPNTMQNYFAVWKNHISPYLRTFHVATFDSTNAIKFFTLLAEGGASVNTRKSCRSVLSVMIGLAVKMEYRTDNPVKGLNVGKEAANKSIKVINETVFWDLCSHLPLEPQRLFAEYIISTGAASVRPSRSTRGCI